MAGDSSMELLFLETFKHQSAEVTSLFLGSAGFWSRSVCRSVFLRQNLEFSSKFYVQCFCKHTPAREASQPAELTPQTPSVISRTRFKLLESTQTRTFTSEPTAEPAARVMEHVVIRRRTSFQGVRYANVAKCSVLMFATQSSGRSERLNVFISSKLI